LCELFLSNVETNIDLLSERRISPPASVKIIEDNGYKEQTIQMIVCVCVYICIFLIVTYSFHYFGLLIKIVKERSDWHHDAGHCIPFKWN
jgi:hypothetical protein